MTLRTRLFGAIGVTLCAVLGVLVALTFTSEWERGRRVAAFHETTLEYATEIANSLPTNRLRNSVLMRDGALHHDVRSLGVYRWVGEAEVKTEWVEGDLLVDAAAAERARALVKRAIDEPVDSQGDVIAHTTATAVAVPAFRSSSEGGATGVDRFVYVELQPLDIDPSSASRATFLVIVAAGLALLLLTWFIVDRVVVRPLHDVVAGAQRIAEGDYGTPVPETSADDEISKVVHAFNVMMVEIAGLQDRLHDRIGDAVRRARRTQESLVIAQRLAATGTLAAGIAHEVNNPLGGMMNAVRSLRHKEMTPERQAEYLELIDEGLQRIQATVAKILQFTPHKVAPQPVALNDVVKPVVALANHRIERQDVEVDLDLCPDGGPVFGDFYELQQALLNVVLNALDAIEEVEDHHAVTPHILIRTRTREDEVELLIRDNGPGMDPEDVPRAFDLFFTTKEQGKGSGLGLATVHKILEDHGGRVELSPRDNAAGGTGLDVIFTLPRRRD